MMFPRPIRFLALVLVAIWLSYQAIVSYLVDWLWYDAAGHLELFTTRFLTQAGLGVGVFVGAWLFIWLNLRYAARSKPLPLARIQEQISEVPLEEKQLLSFLKLAGMLISFFPAWLLASVSARQWLYALAFLDRIPFGKTDAVFGNDIGFYVFELPLIGFAQSVMVSLVVLTLLMVGALSVLRDIFLEQGKVQLHPPAVAQLLFLCGIFFALLGLGWFLDRYEVLFSREGVVWGAGYADINARIPAFTAMAVLSAVVSVVSFTSIAGRKLGRVAVSVGIYVAVRLLLTGAWPSLIQDLMVEPNELEYERPYLIENISSTRAAYALERIDVQPFEADAALAQEDIAKNPMTINNVRVWDDRPLLTTYAQIQEIRTYYDFVDVDVDRYIIDGELRQVMLSGRELNYGSIDAGARSWVNEHFQYTHGYGFTMSPVNVVTTEGLPDLFVKDIPPVAKVDLEMPRPEIYYGEKTNSYVIVGGGIDEFDYPEGETNKYTRYAGKGGVDIGPLWKRALFSAYWGSIELLLSQYITGDSRILFRRNIVERAELMAPFLLFDKDPYLVIADGRMKWILDAYTTTESYPYSEPVLLKSTGRTGGSKQINYMRNSVKVVIDAYDGDVSFYISDTKDPLIGVYSKIFPDTFLPLEKLSDSLSEHLRYPVDFFDTQAWMYRAYHMTDPNVFYNKEDMWNTPRELYDGEERLMASYYLIMKLPEEEEAEFVLLLPFVPTGKDNMISWLAARSDGENYGRLVLFSFPKQKLIYGPLQIEARIDQDPDISQQLTLWSQSGSKVVRGNLLVIPIEDSLIYVEPLYLKADSSQLPELKRVLVSYDSNIAMEPTLGEALAKIFGEPVAERPPQGKLEVITPATEEGGEWSSLAVRASSVFRQAEGQQRGGDWAGYGESLQELSAILTQLENIAGGAGEDPGETEEEETEEPEEDEGE